MIIVRGNEESTSVIRKHCVDNIQSRVFTPKKGETVDATSETHIYQVIFHLYFLLKFKNQ